MKKTFKEVRTLSIRDLRALCIVNDWYTCGDNEDYEHLLQDLCWSKDNLTTEDVVEIAEDIIAHSEGERLTVSDVCFKVNSAAVTVFVEV